jgi:hypothetical protein
MTNGSCPIIEESSRGSLRGMIQAVEGLPLVDDSDTVVVPGHSPIGNRESLLVFRDMLCTIEGRIKPLIASGSPVAGILAAGPTADFDRLWGRGYVTGDIFVRMILAGFGLTQESPRTLVMPEAQERLSGADA